MAPKADPKEAKTDQKTSSDVVKNEKSESVDFLHPSVAKSVFLVPNGRQYGALLTPGNDFLSD